MSDDDFGLMWQSTQAACPTLADLMKQACQEPLSSGSSLDSQSSTNSNPSSSSGSSLGSQQKRPRTRPPRRAAPVQTEEQKYLAAKLERMVKNAYVNAKSTPSQPIVAAPTPSSRVTVAASTARQASRNRDDAMDMDVDDQQPPRRVERVPRSVGEDVDMQLDDTPTTTGARLYPRLPPEDKQHHAARPHTRPSTSSSRHSTTLSASASTFPASSFAPASSTSTTNPPTFSTTNPPTFAGVPHAFAKPSAPASNPNPKSSAPVPAFNARLPTSTSTKALGMRRSLPPTTSTTSTGSGSRTFKPPLAPTKAASVPSLPIQQPRKPLAEVQQQTTTVSVVLMPKPAPQPPKPELKQTVLPESDEDDAGSSNDSFGIDLDIVEAVLSQYD